MCTLKVREAEELSVSGGKRKDRRSISCQAWAVFAYREPFFAFHAGYCSGPDFRQELAAPFASRNPPPSQLAHPLPNTTLDSSRVLRTLCKYAVLVFVPSTSAELWAKLPVSPASVVGASCQAPIFNIAPVAPRSAAVGGGGEDLRPESEISMAHFPLTQRMPVRACGFCLDCQCFSDCRRLTSHGILLRAYRMRH